MPKIEIDLFGEVNEKLVSYFNANIKDLKEGQKVVLIVNSPGGSVTSGNTIISLMNKSKAVFETEIIGMCASMATVIAMSTTKISMAENATMMLHAPAAFPNSRPTADNLENLVEELRKTESNMIAVYAKKSGMGEDEIRYFLNSTRSFRSKIY